MLENILCVHIEVRNEKERKFRKSSENSIDKYVMVRYNKGD